MHYSMHINFKRFWHGSRHDDMYLLLRKENTWNVRLLTWDLSLKYLSSVKENWVLHLKNPYTLTPNIKEIVMTRHSCISKGWCSVQMAQNIKNRYGDTGTSLFKVGQITYCERFIWLWKGILVFRASSVWETKVSAIQNETSTTPSLEELSAF